MALALLCSTGIEMTHTHFCQKRSTLTTEVIVSGWRFSIRDAGWDFPCTHATQAQGRGADRKHVCRSICMSLDGFARVLHGCIIHIIAPSTYFPTNCFQPSLSSRHSSWDQQLQEAHGREHVLVQVCCSGYRQQAKTQLFPSSSPEDD